MQKTVLTFGLLSGAVAAILMWATLPFLENIGYDRAAIVGYTGIVASFLFVYFGVRSYRDNVAGGTLTFGKAFGIGLLITLISCVCYVISWEVMYFKMMPDFAEKFAARQIQELRASGATQAAIDAMTKRMADFKTMYENPFMNAAMTFTEPFPVGLLMTLISAAVLKRKKATV